VRFSVLASGSRGNATLVCTESTRILVDAGLSGRELGRRLNLLGVTPDSLSAILITHEHGDHTRGAGVFARAHGTPLYMTAGTRHACRKSLRGNETVHVYRPGYELDLGDLRIDPCITVHDAADPVAVAVADASNGLRLGIATDLGKPTIQVRHALRGCDALVIESNHDEAMLWDADYPVSVKSRIASSHGHLSNRAAADFASQLTSSRLSVVVLAHLSEETNTPELARSVMSRALRREGFAGEVLVAGMEEPTPLLDLVELRRRAAPAQLSLF